MVRFSIGGYSEDFLIRMGIFLFKLVSYLYSARTKLRPKILRNPMVHLHIRSSRPEMFCKKEVLRNFPKFTRKHLRQSLFFNRVAGFAKRDSCEFCKFLRTPFLTENLRWLLLYMYWVNTKNSWPNVLNIFKVSNDDTKTVNQPQKNWRKKVSPSLRMSDFPKLKLISRQ